MEEHRLKAMPPQYDENLFNELYKKTEGLRRKLAYEINPSRFGVDNQEIKSWFDVKFLYTFQKYHDKKEPEMLKGYIINSLRVFKMRVLKVGYNQKNELHNTVDITGLYDNSAPEADSSRELFLNLALEFMKKRLTAEAFFLLKLQLNPPEYITSKAKNRRVPPELWCRYLDLGTSSKEISFIVNLFKEIQNVTLEAQQFFSNKDLSLYL
jgi:hypothetical protein